MQLKTKAALNSTFKEFWLRTAESILRNNANILAAQNDIEACEQIKELLDGYSIRIMLTWLATKYGSNPCMSDIESGSPNQLMATERLLLTTGLFPFETDTDTPDYNSLLADSFDFLNNRLTADLSLIGRFYQYLCSRSLEPNSNPERKSKRDIRLVSKSKYVRRNTGQFYTPPEVVTYCLRQGLPKDLISLMKQLESSDSIFKILDPACGTGNFLIGSLDLFKKLAAAPQMQYKFATRSLYGIDIDSRAVALARHCLLISLISAMQELSGSDASEFVRLYEDACQALKGKIIVADSLIAALCPVKPDDCQSRSDWLVPDSNGQNGFDLVITNPPYVSFGARDQKTLSDTASSIYRANYPISSEYKIRLNAIFHEIALRYTKPDSNFALLVPNGFLTGRRYARLRQGLIENTRIVSLNEFPQTIIAEATVGRWCAAVYQKAAVHKKTAEYADSYNVELTSFSEGQDLEPSRPTRYDIPINRLVTKDHHRFQLVFCRTDEEAVFRLGRLHRLGDSLRGHTGIRARHGQKTIISPKKLGSNWHKGLNSGGQVCPYQALWDGTWIHIEPPLLYAGGFDQHVIENPKILVRQTGDRIIAAIDRCGFYHLNNLHSFSSQKLKKPSPNGEKPDLNLIVSLMNSTLWRYIYRLKTREDGRPLAQIDIETIEEMPVPSRQIDIESAIKALSLSLESFCDPIEKSSLTRIRAIDRLVYCLYEMQESEIHHIENDLSERFGDAKAGTATPLPDIEDALALSKNPCPRDFNRAR